MGLVLIFWLMGLLMIGLAIPLLRRRIPPNALYGLRVGETLENEEVWYEANARSARELVLVGLGTVVGSTILFALPWGNHDHCVLVCCAFLIVGVLWYCLRGLRIAREVKQEFAGRPDKGEAE